MDWKATVELTKLHGGEAIRECGVLWLVFSLLDRMLSGHLTFPWVVWNLSGSIAAWITGMYIEVKRKE